MTIFPQIVWPSNIGATTTVHAFPTLTPKADGDSALVSIAIGAVLIGFICSSLAVSIYVRLVKIRRAAAAAAAGYTAAIGLREKLISGSQETVLVLGAAAPSFDAGNANALLQSCMKGRDGKALAIALERFLKLHTPFEMAARKAGHGSVAVRAVMVAGCTTLYLRDFGARDVDVDLGETLNTVEIPIWVRGPDLALRWANQAFLNIVGAQTLGDALSSNKVLERSELDLAEAARNGSEPIDAVRYTLVKGERRALSLHMARLGDKSLAGCAVDVTPVTRAEAQLRLNADAAADMLEAMPLAIGIFDVDKRLKSYNELYARMWSLDSTWLDGHPSFGEILDRLRETRQLPEQHDFQEWKRCQLELFDVCKVPREEHWHLPNGKSIRLKAQPHLLGGVFFILEDVSEKLRLESSFRLLNQVQRATLNAVEEAVAIFAPDGHLVLHNDAFEKLWHLSEDDLADQPHFREIAKMCDARTGVDGIWSIVSAGIAANEPERCNEWGKTRSADGRSISLAMSRLPNGATAVTFTDFTEIARLRGDRDHVVA